MKQNSTKSNGKTLGAAPLLVEPMLHAWASYAVFILNWPARLLVETDGNRILRGVDLENFTAVWPRDF